MMRSKGFDFSSKPPRAQPLGSRQRNFPLPTSFFVNTTFSTAFRVFSTDKQDLIHRILAALNRFGAGLWKTLDLTPKSHNYCDT